MFKKVIIVLAVVLVSSSFVCAKVGDNVHIGGTYLGVFNAFKNIKSQFNSASNIDFSFQINKRLKAVLQLQGGSGSGTLAFSDQSISFSLIK